MHPAVFLMPRVLRLCSGSFHSLVWCLRGHTQPCFILLEFIQETLYQVGSLACIKNVEIHACVYGDSLVCPLEPLVFEIICLIVLRLWGVTTLCVHSNTITLFLFLFLFLAVPCSGVFFRVSVLFLSLNNIRKHRLLPADIHGRFLVCISGRFVWEAICFTSSLTKTL